MKYVFISPNYPSGHYRYVAALRNAGHEVYAIGDAGIETFSAELRGNISEYYRVGDLHDYEQVYRACCYFISRYGRFQAVESLNGYWLDLVAALRNDFLSAVTSPQKMYSYLVEDRHASDISEQTMIICYDPVAPDIAKILGYPVLLVPKKNKLLGMRRIDNDEDLMLTLSAQPDEQWLIRHLVDGEPVSVDALCYVQPNDDYWCEMICVALGIHSISPDGCRCAIPAESLKDDNLADGVLPYFQTEDNGMVFFHADCVRLQRSIKHVGQKGDLILNNVIQAPPPEYIIDCMNIEYDCDLRELWARNEYTEPLERKYLAATACRSFDRSYKNPHEKVLRRLAARLRCHGITDEPARGEFLDYHYIFSGESTAELRRGIKLITEDHPLPAQPECAEAAPSEVSNAAEAAPKPETAQTNCGADAAENLPEE